MIMLLSRNGSGVKSLLPSCLLIMFFKSTVDVQETPKVEKLLNWLRLPIRSFTWDSDMLSRFLLSNQLCMIYS